MMRIEKKKKSISKTFMSRLSLVQILASFYAFSAFVSVFLVVSFMYWFLQQHIKDDDRKLLEGKYKIIDEILSHHGADTERLKSEVGQTTGSNGPANFYVRILNGTEKILLETETMDKEVSIGFDCPVDNLYAVCVIRTKNQKLFHILSSSIKEYNGGRFRIIIGLDRTAEEQLVSDFREICFWILLSTLFTSLVIGYIITTKGMAPLKKIERAVVQISSETLSERLEVLTLPKELMTLALKFNGMMDRLENSFGQLNRFSADIAHDLRTPINNLRGGIEVALGRERTVDEYQDLLVSSLEECERISLMIDNLLFLARAEEPNARINLEVIHLFTELENIKDYFGSDMRESPIGIKVRVDESLVFQVDKGLFRRAIANLISNSLKHTIVGSITIFGWVIDSNLVIEVEDTGMGISEKDLPFVFDRFYRADAARSTSGSSSGLGLSIVRGIMDLHGGKATISSTEGKGTKVILSFPRQKF